MSKYKKKAIPTAVRNAVWNTYIGEEYGRGECYICNGVISHGTFACGHIIAEVNGGETTLKNLRPICPSCNSSQGTKNMIEFKKEYGLKGKDINKIPKNIDVRSPTEETTEPIHVINGKLEKKIRLRQNIIDDNIKKLDSTKIILLKQKKFLRSYKSQWKGIENYRKKRMFAPSKFDIQSILIEFDKDMLKIICDDLSIEYFTKCKKNELIQNILTMS